MGSIPLIPVPTRTIRCFGRLFFGNGIAVRLDRELASNTLKLPREWSSSRVALARIGQVRCYFRCCAEFDPRKTGRDSALADSTATSYLGAHAANHGLPQ
jgi:hypothetical protein